MKRSQRAVILAGFFVLVLGIVLLITLRPRSAVAPAPFASTPAPTLAPSASGQPVSCGLVTAYASDGAQMRLTLEAGGAMTQYASNTSSRRRRRRPRTLATASQPTFRSTCA